MLARSARPILAACAILVAVSTNARAQDLAHTFDQLRVLLKPGDTVTVTDDAGHETTGKIADLSASSLALVASGGRRALIPAEVTMIRQRRHGSLATGAKVGFGLGAGLAVVSLAGNAGGCRGCSGFFVAATLLDGALGAGIGVGISAATTHDQIIFAKTLATEGRVTVAPIVTRQRQGLRVSFGF